MFHQVEGLTYDFEASDWRMRAETNWALESNKTGPLAVTHLGCTNLFGHEACLLAARRP